MFGFRYVKAPPTAHVIHFRGGRIVREGAGLSFFCFSPNSTIVQLPVASTDVPFVFEEVTSDFQDVTIQGELTYRIADPNVVANVLDFSINLNGRYASDDPTKLNDRLIQATQTSARSFVQQQPLRNILVSSNALVQHLLQGLKGSSTIEMLGVEILGLTLQSIKPTPEMAKALQADAREKLLQQADEAVYARRNTAIELEREIKENELNTEVAVEQKRRQVRTTKLEADIALEQQRAELVDTKVENERKESLARADALRAMLDPVKDIDWRTLMAAQSGGLDAKQLIAMAFRDLADNSDQIGNLNITPDLLSSLLENDERATVANAGNGGPLQQRRGRKK